MWEEEQICLMNLVGPILGEMGEDLLGWFGLHVSSDLLLRYPSANPLL
jgi:hypothetical protein